MTSDPRAALLAPARAADGSSGIRAAGLAKRFGELTAVRQVDLAVRYGEVVGLLGPNGAGKTTLLRLLAGILAPSAGQAWIAGHEVAAAPLQARARLGYLSGGTALYARLTVRETLRYFGRLHSLAEPLIASRMARLVEELEMAPFLDQRCGTLSSGQRQRANIARAFLHDPPVLILDEPTSSLDVVSGSFILESIRRARAAGRAVLFSTHIMSEAEVLCDRIVLLHQGRVLDEGPLADLLARAGQPNLTETFLAHARDLAADGRKTAENP
jgi:sodium transport system ATP-binding protein